MRIFKGKDKSKKAKHPVRKVVGLFDLHAPLHEEAALRAALEFIKNYKPHELVIGGDLGEFESVSHWIQNKKRKVEGKRLGKEYQACNEILDRVEKVLPKGCKKIFLLGNHEEWVEQYLDNFPAMEGLIDLETGLRLKKRGYKIIPFNKPYQIGKANIIHGWYAGVHHAKKHIDNGHKNLIYGHVHDAQRFSSPSLDNFHSAISVPCMCRLNKDFLHNKPTNWSHGFLVLEVRRDGFFNAHVMDIVNGKFSYNGRIYGK